MVPKFYAKGLVPLFALLSAIAVSGCSRQEPAPEPVRSVKVITVGADTLGSGHEFSGEVRAQVESRLGFRVPGKIVRRHVEVGQAVKAGQVLAQLDPRDLHLAAEAAHAQLAAATTQRDLAAADFHRFAALREQNFISGAELERRETALKAAQAQYEQARAQFAAQSNQAAYASLVADVSGVVTAIEAEAGQVVAAGTPVVRIAQDGQRDVVFAVPETQVAQIGKGSPATVKPWAGGTELVGTVREVAASADPVTRTYTVKVALPRNVAPPPLGATVSVVPQALGPTGRQVIKLPTSALRQAGQGTAVWLLDRTTMTVKSQPVQVATVDGNEAVIASGIEPGMLVVASGVHVLAPGQKVAIYERRADASQQSIAAGPDERTQASAAAQRK